MSTVFCLVQVCMMLYPLTLDLTILGIVEISLNIMRLQYLLPLGHVYNQNVVII
jgi:hypothetical protein